MEINTRPSKSAETFQVSGIVGYPIINNYQDKYFASKNFSRYIERTKGQTESKYSKNSPVLMVLPEEQEVKDFEWDPDF